MSIAKKISRFVGYLQQLPENSRKVIFFSTMALVIFIIGFLGIILTKKNISLVGKSFQGMSIPKIDIPERKLGENSLDFEKLGEALKAIDLGNVSEGNNGVLQNNSEDNNEINTGY